MAFSPVSFASEGYSNIPVKADFSDYMSDINYKLQKNWTPPDFLEEGHVKIIFKLDKSGNLISGSVIESSGDSIYDESAMAALSKSLPFGNFPVNAQRETITVKYSFDTTLVKTDKMKEYYDQAKRYTYSDRQEALKYINLAIAEVQGDENSYFLYKRRAKIKEGLGDHIGAKADLEQYKNMKAKVDLKRMHALRHQAEIEDSAYVYYYLAYAYEQLEDYDNAIWAIDKAIERTDLNNQYKRYKAELKNKQSLSNADISRIYKL